MSIKHIPGAEVVVPPGTIEINWTVTEDEFLLLIGMLGKTRYSLLDGEYYEATELRNKLDNDRSRTRTIMAKCIPELAR
jgi:hypothetical protein